MAEDTAIEKLIKSFVLQRTGDDVYLDVAKSNCVCVKHRSKRGSVVLATMWVNVLQHNNNFPVSRYPYKNLYDANGIYKVILRVDDITITVFMSTGTLMIQGSYVIQWFMQKFENILIAFSLPEQEPQPINDSFCKDREAWNEMVYRRKLKEETERQKEKEKEDLALLILEQDAVKKEIVIEKTAEGEKKEDELQNELTDMADKLEDQYIKDEINDVAEYLEMMSVSAQSMLTGDCLQQQLENLRKGAVKDGPTYIYKIWKSLLSKWFSEENSHVFIATPFLDADRLEDICRILLENKLTASVDALYVRRHCDHKQKISDIKRETQLRLSPKDQVYIEYKLYSSIIYPLARFHAKFIACVKDGFAQVLITSANFHADHFVHANAESIMFTEMSEAEFSSRFLKPITASVDR